MDDLYLTTNCKLHSQQAIVDFLQKSGYRIEYTPWDFADLPPSARNRIAQMLLIANYSDSVAPFQIFLIELTTSQVKERFSRADVSPILDSFLRRYPQGEYLFIFAYADYSNILLANSRRVVKSGNKIGFWHCFWRIDPQNLRYLDWWLLHQLILSSSEVDAAQIAKKHCKAFNEAHCRRIEWYRQFKGDYSELLDTYLLDVYRHSLLTDEEERYLAIQIRQGDKDAKEKFIRANLRLVVHEARKYCNLGLELLDLIQEGNMGLMEAIDRFDPSLGHKFSTYATWWIRQRLTRALADKSHLIRLPVHAFGQLNRIAKAERRVENLLQRPATDEEIALETGWFSREERTRAWFGLMSGVENLDARLKKKIRKVVHRVERIRRVAKGILSLDMDIPPEIAAICGLDEQAILDSPCLSEVIPDTKQYEQMEQDDFGALRGVMGELLSVLSERQRFVIEMRYGFRDGDEHTLEEVGDLLGVTRERVRQIEKKALKRLRHPIRRRKLVKMTGLVFRKEKEEKEEDKAEVQTAQEKGTKGIKEQTNKQQWLDSLKEWEQLPPYERRRRIFAALGCSTVSERLSTDSNSALEEFISSYEDLIYRRRLSYRQSKQLSELIQSLDDRMAIS